MAWSRIVLPDHADVEKGARHRFMHRWKPVLPARVHSYASFSAGVPLPRKRYPVLNPPYDFTGTVEHLNIALFRVTIEVLWALPRDLGIWLAA